jgi:propionate CoA-transferase
MDEEALLLGQLPLAQAAKNSGGIVIAQVKYLAEAASLHPKHVRVPAPLVDYVVVASSPHLHKQAAATLFDPALSGDMKAAGGSFTPLPMGPRLLALRRAAMELVPGAVVNLGVGYPDGLGDVADEEGVADMLTLTTEPGAVGGEPEPDLNFGTARNAQALLEMHAMFDWYDGGGLDIAFLGLAQADQHGNVNVSQFSGQSVGPGGFINISQATPTLVYCGSFTAGGLQITVGDGQVRVVKEGRIKKFVADVEQITFSGAEAARRGQKVCYVTERAVLELIGGRMTLTEIAPGVDLQHDVLAQMEFAPDIAKPLRAMPADIFREKWGKLPAIMNAKRGGPY